MRTLFCLFHISGKQNLKKSRIKLLYIINYDLFQNLKIIFEVAIRTAPVSLHSFAIRTVFVLHMRNKAMFNLFVRRMFLKFIRTAAKGAAQYRHIVDHYYCRLMTRYGNAAFKTILTHWDYIYFTKFS